jgi:hypothetical protein
MLNREQLVLVVERDLEVLEETRLTKKTDAVSVHSSRKASVRGYLNHREVQCHGCKMRRQIAVSDSRTGVHWRTQRVESERLHERPWKDTMVRSRIDDGETRQVVRSISKLHRKKGPPVEATFWESLRCWSYSLQIADWVDWQIGSLEKQCHSLRFWNPHHYWVFFPSVPCLLDYLL